MAIRTRYQQAVRGSAVPLVAVGLTAYFGYHAFSGDHGLFAKLRLERQVETLRTELQLVRTEREAVERRVLLLRPESLDPDMLEERVRELLNFVHPNDVMILRDEHR
jgi:cell division protein FtsB